MKIHKSLQDLFESSAKVAREAKPDGEKEERKEPNKTNEPRAIGFRWVHE